MDIRHFFRREKEAKEIKDRVLRDMNNLFKHEEEPVRVNNFWSNNYINMKVTAIQIKHYQLKNILIKFGHI